MAAALWWCSVMIVSEGVMWFMRGVGVCVVKVGVWAWCDEGWSEGVV